MAGPAIDVPEDRTFAPRDRLNSAEPCRRDHRIGLQPDRTAGSGKDGSPSPGEPRQTGSTPQP